VIAKVVCGAALVAVVPVSLWLGGALPPPPQPSAPVDTIALNPGLAERQWRERVNVICRWERKRVKSLGKVFRGTVATPANVIFLLDGIVRLGRSSLGVFTRLEAPFAFRREARELRRLIRRSQTAIEGMRDGVQDHRLGMFLRNAERVVRIEKRKRALLHDIGLKGCVPPPPEPPLDSDTQTV
jgi:hypothetical protein